MNSISSERFLNQVKSLVKLRIPTHPRKNHEIGIVPIEAVEGTIAVDKVHQEGRTTAVKRSDQTPIVATVLEKEMPIKAAVLAMTDTDLTFTNH